MPRCSKRQRSSASTPTATTIPSQHTIPHTHTHTPAHATALTHISPHLTTSTLEPHHHNKRSRHSSGRRCSRSEDTSFSVKRCLAWFREYTTADDPDVLGPEGMEKFCEDIGVEPENVVMLVVAYKMGAKQMGYFTQEEWFQGLAELQCDSISKLQGKLDYLRSLLSDPLQFKGIYRYAYDFARDKDQRSLDAVTGRAMLQLLLGGAWPLLPRFCAFLETSRYKVINRDQWCNILEFSRTVSLHLDNYDADGAWPVMLDEFVEWLRQERDQTDISAEADS